MEDSNNKRFNKRHHYTMKAKLKIINYYLDVDEKIKMHTESEILKKYGVEHKSLENSEKNELKIRDSDNRKLCIRKDQILLLTKKKKNNSNN